MIRSVWSPALSVGGTGILKTFVTALSGVSQELGLD